MSNDTGKILKKIERNLKESSASPDDNMPPIPRGAPTQHGIFDPNCKDITFQLRCPMCMIISKRGEIGTLFWESIYNEGQAHANKTGHTLRYFFRMPVASGAGLWKGVRGTIKPTTRWWKFRECLTKWGIYIGMSIVWIGVGAVWGRATLFWCGSGLLGCVVGYNLYTLWKDWKRTSDA